MKVEVQMHDLSKLKKSLLKADMNHLKYSLQDEMVGLVEKFRNDRGIRFKIVRLLGGIKGLGKVTVDSLLTGLESLSINEVINYWIEDEMVEDKIIHTKITRLTIEVSDDYFQFFEAMPIFGSVLKRFMGGKKQFIKELKKSVKDDYTKKYKMFVDGKEVEE